MKPELNYFKLSLQEFLQNSHPHLLGDDGFITARADLAAATYEDAVRNGSNQADASELANEVLFTDLHFSKHDTLVEILWEGFADQVPEYKAKELAIELSPKCEPVFAKYPLSDNFAYESEYEQLYTELTGTIALYLEK
jgi:hypothetical protein